MYSEIHVEFSYFNRDTNQNNATRRNTKTELSVALTSVQLKIC